MDNVRRKHLSFRKTRIKMLVSDQVAETCDACDRTEDLRALRFSIYADFYVLDEYWPDFNKNHISEAFKWYNTQDVTLGG